MGESLDERGFPAARATCNEDALPIPFARLMEQVGQKKQFFFATDKWLLESGGREFRRLHVLQHRGAAALRLLARLSCPQGSDEPVATAVNGLDVGRLPGPVAERPANLSHADLD